MPYVAVADLRGLPNLSDTVRFPDAELAAATVWFETVFEDHTGVAWEPRTVLGEAHYLTRADTLILRHLRPRTITAVNVHTSAIAATPYTADELAALHFDEAGVVRRLGTTGGFTSEYGLVTVDYTHGYDAPPADVVEAAKEAIRQHLLDDYQANRQISVATEAGIVRTSTPGQGHVGPWGKAPDRPFGLLKSDEVANRRIHKFPGVAVIG